MKNEENQANEELKNCESVVVIDDDNDVRRLICDHLEKSGIKLVRDFGDGAAAWEEISQNNYDAIILDWKLPGLNGAAIVNRARKHPMYEFKPVVIISGFLNKKDFSLLEDVPFTALIEKPFQGAFLNRKLKDLVKDIQWFNSERPRIDELSANLAAKKNVSLDPFIEFLKTAPKPIPFAIAAARTLIAQNNFIEAEKILNFILNKFSNCVLAMTELGKVYLKTNRKKEAETILKKAYELSPENIERLCMLGDTSLQNLNVEAADHYFSKAVGIDPDDKTAQAGLTLTGNVSGYLGRSDITSIPGSFASLLNAIGVSIVNNQQFQEGIEHYKSAMQFVSDSEKRAKLAYNLGLGFLKWEKPTQAFEWFEKSVRFSEGHFQKAVRNVTKLKEMFQKKGMPLPTVGDISEAMPAEEIKFTAVDHIKLKTPDYSLEENFENFGSFDQLEFSLGTPPPVVTPESAPEADAEPDSGAEEDALTRFKSLVPFADTYCEKLKRQGERVEANIEKILPLFDQHDMEVVIKALEEGMRIDSCRASHIIFMLGQQSLKKAS